jgi:hypothetical protein
MSRRLPVVRSWPKSGKQIALARRAAEAFNREWKVIPRAVGFWQLAVILEKQGNYNEAIALAT